MALDDRYRSKPFDEALAYLRGKISIPGDVAIRDAEHDAAFTIAGAKGSLLGELRQAVEQAIESGQTLEEFSSQFDRIADGWIAEGGRDWRARIVYQTNLRMSYAAGRYQYQLDPDVLEIQPYLQFIHSDASVPRPAHRALDGKVFRARELPFYPPSGFGCGCRTISLSDRLVRDRDLEISDLRRGDVINGVRLEPDPGFDYIPGQSSPEQRRQMLEDIIARSPEPIAQQIRRAVDRIDAEFASRESSVERPDPRTPQPAGIPVSRALKLSKGVKSIKPLVDLIDSIHGDGDLPGIPVRKENSKQRLGGYTYYENQQGKSKPGFITVTLDETAELTLAHEIGHFLDQQAIGNGRYASIDDPSLQQWREAIENSDTVQALRLMLDVGAQVVNDVSGQQIVDLTSGQIEYLKYLLLPQELFARSYSQYILSRSGDDRLTDQIDSMLSRRSLTRFSHWIEEDFAPIAAAFDQLLIDLGWVK